MRTRFQPIIVGGSGLIAPLLGHVGDGNFHVVILIGPKDDREVQAAKVLAHRVNQLALSVGGTVTGEHAGRRFTWLKSMARPGRSWVTSSVRLAR